MDLRGHPRSSRKIGKLAGPAVHTVVSAQVALSMVLLVEAALFARSEDRALRADPGYAPQRVVVAPLHFPDNSTIESARVRHFGRASRSPRAHRPAAAAHSGMML